MKRILAILGIGLIAGVSAYLAKVDPKTAQKQLQAGRKAINKDQHVRALKKDLKQGRKKIQKSAKKFGR